MGQNVVRAVEKRGTLEEFEIADRDQDSGGQAAPEALQARRFSLALPVRESSRRKALAHELFL